VRSAVALTLACGALATAGLLYCHRDGVLHVMTRVRGLGRSTPGPLRRYRSGVGAQLDMAVPILLFLAVGVLFLVVGVAAF
jgi:hypothetical protein